MWYPTINRDQMLFVWIENRIRTWQFRIFVLISTICCFGLNSSQAQSIDYREYQIKAAFLYNFAQFIEWPSGAFQNDNTPICIGVLGDNPFGSSLADTVRGETIHNRKVIVEYFHNVEDVKHCHLLFISKSEKAHVSEILSDLNGSPVMTVSEVEGFASFGGGINFYLEDNKVRFEINPASAYSRGIKLSSQLLNLAKIVVQKAPGTGN